MYYKAIQKGEDKVCEAIREYAAKSYDEGKDDGINIGIAKGTVKTLINLVNSGDITIEFAIANYGLSKEEFSATAKELGLSY